MAQVLLAVGASIVLMLGTFHGVLTLLDTVRPRYFTPTDDGVRIAMERAKRLVMQGRMPLSPRANLWRAWLGFNLSHSLGVVVFSGTLLYVALHHFGIFAESMLLQCAVLAVSVAYFVISLRFWFWVPTLGISAALLCFLGAVVLG